MRLQPPNRLQKEQLVDLQPSSDCLRRRSEGHQGHRPRGRPGLWWWSEPPCEVPGASALVGTSPDQGESEFVDEQEDDAEMAVFKELVSVSPACLFILSFCVCFLILPFWLDRK